MAHERQDRSATFAVSYGSSRTSSGPESYERSASQKAADAATIADNFDRPLAVATAAIAQIDAAAEAGDIAGWKAAMSRADAAIKQAERVAVAAAKVVQDATDLAVKQRLKCAAERLRDAKELVAAAPPEPRPTTPELTCRDTLLAALPPFPFPPSWRDPDRRASILAVFAVFQSQMTTSDIEAFRAIISLHKDDEIALRFNQFGEERRMEFLERISKDDIKRPAIAREMNHRAETKRRNAAADRSAPQGHGAAEAQPARAAGPTGTEGHAAIAAGQPEPQGTSQPALINRAVAAGERRVALGNAREAPRHIVDMATVPRGTEDQDAWGQAEVKAAPASVDVRDRRSPEGDAAPPALATMPAHEGAWALKTSGKHAPDHPSPREIEPDGPSVQRMSGGPGTPGLHKNINYDKVGHPLSMLPKETTLSAVKVGIDFLKDSKPPEITDAGVLGVASGSEAEIFVWNVIVQLGRKERWGSEADLETAIGFPSPSGNPPIGKVTLRIDTAGKAAAELLKGRVAGGTSFSTLDEATAKLKSDFGVSAVTNGSAIWTLEELGKVHAALSTMSGEERAALVGVSLVREHTLPQTNGRVAAGQFSHDARPDPTTGTATRTESLSLADSAFQTDNVSFVGGANNAAPSSSELIVHEAGHAFETQLVRDAEFARVSADAQRNQNLTALAQARNDALDAQKEFNSKASDIRSHMQAYKPAERVAMKGYVSALHAASQALSDLSRTSTSQESKALEAKAVAAVASRRAEQTKLGAHASHPVLKDLAAAEIAQDAWLAAAQKGARALASLEESQVASDSAGATENATKGTHGESKRLAKFVAFVNQHQIEPFTDYARNNWPANPGEFYAEAFSLFHTDPEFLQANYKSLYNWFATGEHLK